MTTIVVKPSADADSVVISPATISRWEDEGVVPAGTAAALEDPAQVEAAAADIAAAVASEGV